MSNTEHPITPPPELVRQWRNSWHHAHGESGVYIATQASHWGADQELKACELYLAQSPYPTWAKNLRAARRPKPPSLKEQALAELEKVDMLWDTSEFGPSTLSALDTIRRALEQLPDTL